jgi:hypothetical protein
MGVVKSKYVPEEVRLNLRERSQMTSDLIHATLMLQVRATIYNIFRIPLNIIVCSVLANLKTFSGLSIPFPQLSSIRLLACAPSSVQRAEG